MGCLVRHETTNYGKKTAIVNGLEVLVGNFFGIKCMIHSWKENTNGGAISHFSQGNIWDGMHGNMYGIVLL